MSHHTFPRLHRYTAPNRKQWVQLSTPGPNGWLISSGPANTLPKVREYHNGLVDFATDRYGHEAMQKAADAALAIKQ